MDISTTAINYDDEGAILLCLLILPDKNIHLISIKLLRRRATLATANSYSWQRQTDSSKIKAYEWKVEQEVAIISVT